MNDEAAPSKFDCVPVPIRQVNPKSMQYFTAIFPFVMAAVGIWLMLPRGQARGRRLGSVCAVVALGMLAWRTPRVVGWLDQSVFASLAVTTIVACAAAIVARNPLYSAIWFGLALLGTAGLFLFIGAQFLSVATITVYAGAILVTFLFVVMLAQPDGRAFYDRLSWEAFLSAATGAILVGLLTAVIGHALGNGAARDVSPEAAAITSADRNQGVLAANHVASFGRELVGRHLVSMQAAGALMLAALVGAVAIVSHGRSYASNARGSGGDR